MNLRIFSLLAAIGALSFFTACGGGGMTVVKTGNTFTVGVSVIGLSSGSLVVQNDASQQLTFTSDATQTFSNAYVSGSTYSVTIKTQPSGETCTLGTNSSGTITANVTVAAVCSAVPTVSANVTGLSGGTLILQDDASQQLTFTADGTQTFSNTYTSGAAYAVTVHAQPTGQTCTLGGNANGTITTPVIVAVTCASTTSTFTVSATVAGLTSGQTVVLANDATQQLTFTTNATQNFTKAYNSGDTYSVAIATPPTGETCTLSSNATGTITANVTVTVNCSAVPTFTVSATVSGLAGGSLVLQNDSSEQLTYSADGTQAFTSAYISGEAYAVTLVSAPVTESCVLSSNATGNITADVTVTVTCTAIPMFTLSAAVTGLSGGTLVLVDDAAQQLSFTTNITQAFGNSYLSGSGYTVAISSAPAGVTCLLGSNATGTITSNTTVTVTCTPATYVISVSVTGLTGTGLVFQDNLTDNLSVPTSGTYPFLTQIASGSPYSVTILTQPSGQTCTFGSGASGTATSDVTVTVTCGAITTYTITATVTGLSGTLKLEDDQSEILTFNADGSQNFPHQYPGGSSYSVTVNSQPSGQSCTLDSNASGNINANTTVTATCVTSTSSGDWTWINGANVVAVGGLYPPSTPAEPGTRWAGATWTDASGNFWLFGGNGYDVNGPAVNSQKGSNEAILSDLWEFKSGAWTFKGGQAQTGQCFDFPTSTGLTGSPSARSDAVSWIDLAGNLWMFGGYENYNVTGSCNLGAAFNDWWKYTPSANTWTWVGGSSTDQAKGIYPSAVGGTGTPGARYWSTGYRDSNGNFWMFGGYAYDSVGTQQGYMNDLWKFDGTNWTWVSGSKTQGTKETSMVPGGRAGANSWIDSSGNFWVFGGAGVDSTGNVGEMNDLWSFNTSTSKWTLVSGSMTADPAGNYGTQGAGDSNTTPGGRFWATSWITPSGDVYLLGGQRFAGGLLNDLWKYSGGMWTWVSPTVSSPVDESEFVNVLGEYGTQGSGNSANAPGSREQGMAWSDSAGNIWLFGGKGLGTRPVTTTQDVHSGYDSLQDLWEFQP